MEVCQGFKQRYSNAELQEKSHSQMPLQKPIACCGLDVVPPNRLDTGTQQCPAARITSVRRAFKSLMQLAVCSRTSLTGWAGCQRPGTAKLTQLILVGGAITILKNMISSMGRIIPYMMENKKCLKPPTRVLSCWTTWARSIPYIYYYYGKIKNVPNHQPGLMSYLFLRRLLGDLWAANSYLTVVLYLYTVPIMFETQNFIIMLVP